jgi:hypothetical protein
MRYALAGSIIAVSLLSISYVNASPIFSHPLIPEVGKTSSIQQVRGKPHPDTFCHCCATGTCKRDSGRR